MDIIEKINFYNYAIQLYELYKSKMDYRNATILTVLSKEVSLEFAIKFDLAKTELETIKQQLNKIETL